MSYKKVVFLLVIFSFCLLFHSGPVIAAENEAFFMLEPPAPPRTVGRPPTPILWMVVPDSVRVLVYSASGLAERIEPGSANFGVTLPPGNYYYNVTAKYRSLPPAPERVEDGFGFGSFTLDGRNDREVRGEWYDTVVRVSLRPALRLDYRVRPLTVPVR